MSSGPRSNPAPEGPATGSPPPPPQPGQPPVDASHADIGIVCALPIELAAFLERCQRVKKYIGADFVFRGGKYDAVRVVVVESGTGLARARRATQALLDAHSPKWVLSCGFAGALLPSIKVGDIVVPDSLVDMHGQSLAVEPGFRAEPERGMYVGRLLTNDAIVRLVEEKKLLAERYTAIAVDMETLAVAQVCRERGARFLAVRVISDDLSGDLPAEVLTLIGATGTRRFGAALGAVWQRPESVKDMWRLRQSAHLASRQLATFLDGVVIQLYNALH